MDLVQKSRQQVNLAFELTSRFQDQLARISRPTLAALDIQPRSLQARQQHRELVPPANLEIADHHEVDDINLIGPQINRVARWIVRIAQPPITSVKKEVHPHKATLNLLHDVDGVRLAAFSPRRLLRHQCDAMRRLFRRICAGCAGCLRVGLGRSLGQYLW